jgi:amino acid transporter
MSKIDKQINLQLILFTIVNIIAFNSVTDIESLKRRIFVSVGMFITYIVVNLLVVVIVSIKSHDTLRRDCPEKEKNKHERKVNIKILLISGSIFLIDLIYILVQGEPLILLLIASTWESTPQYP